MDRFRSTKVLIMLLCLVVSSSAQAEGPRPISPGPQDHCPVCGMFTAPYPDFFSQIIFTDGSYLTFDGPKDLFSYYFSPAKYLPQVASRDIHGIFVTDYYSLVPIDAREAWFVLGSDVFGPMGKELIPFADEAAAREFKQDHHGRTILKFEEISPKTLEETN